MDNRNPEIKSTYQKKLSVLWWTGQWSYLRFILRELTSLPVAYTSILLLFFFRSAIEGPESFHRFLNIMRSPWMIILNLLTLGGLIFHSVTWINLAPRAMVLKIGKKRIPDRWITLLNYGAWILISTAFFLVIR